MGFLDDVKHGLGFDDESTEADKAKKKAEEAKEKSDEAAKEAAERKADADKANKEATDKAGKAGVPAPAPAPKAPAPKTAPPAKKAPAPAAAQRTYTVKKGDTLSEIGEKYGVSYQKIAKANNIDNPDLIFPGQKFIIPD